jgi:hypothetical protein
MKDQKFGNQLTAWLKSSSKKTIADLINVFSEKSFAVVLLVLMIIPALPLPTGGITHVFEVISIVVAFELVIGRKTIWLPKRWLKRDISSISNRKTVAGLAKKLKWIEEHTKPRLDSLIKNNLFRKLTGLWIVLFSITAFLAPPFSGLDTLPSLGVVFIALSIIFEDIYLYIFGSLIGVIGIVTVLTLGSVILHSVNSWL